MRFDQDFIEKVKDANNIVDIISRYTSLKASGHQHMGLCPFPNHKEKTPSFSVSSSKQVYYCFGCKESGNVFTFLERYSGMSFVEALEFLASRASIPMPVVAVTNESPKPVIDKRALLQINEAAVQFFKQQLIHNERGNLARSYFEKRGMSAEQIILFKLGYASDEWDGLTKYLQSQKLNLKLAEDLGLIKAKKQRSGEYFDLYRSRVMFPIFSPSGEVIGFGGRTVTDEKPKYLNSSDSALFSKGKTFYGLHETAKYIRAEDAAIVVEGYMDFLALYQAGIKNVVATLGTAMTPQHAQLLARHTKHVIVLFDGDQAGRLAAERSLPILLQAGLLPRWQILGDGVDPDDWVKNSSNPSELQEQLKSCPDLFSALFRSWLVGFENRPTDVVRVLEQARPILTSLVDPRLRDLYMQEMASGLSVSRSWLAKSLQSEKTEKQNSVKSQLIATSPAPSATKKTNEGLFPVLKANKLEISLLSFAVQKEEFLQSIMNGNMMTMVENLGVREALSFVVEMYRQNSQRFDKIASLLITKLDQPQRVVELLVGTEISSESSQKLLNDCLARIREAHFKREAKALTEQLKDQPNRENLERFMNIQRHRRQLHKKEGSPT